MVKPGDDSKPSGEQLPNESSVTGEPNPVEDQIADKADEVIDNPAEIIEEITDDKDGKLWQQMIEKQIKQGQDQMSAMAAMMTEIKTDQSAVVKTLGTMTETLTKLIPKQLEAGADQVKEKTPDKPAGDDRADQEKQNQTPKPLQWF